MRSYVRCGGGICGREVEGESKESERKPLGSRDVIGEAVKLLYPDMFIFWHCRLPVQVESIPVLPLPTPAFFVADGCYLVDFHYKAGL